MLQHTIQKTVIQFFHKMGYEIVTHPVTEFALVSSVDKVLDVGANTGQYGLRLRRMGYQGQIFSFEPISQVFKQLDKTSRRDKSWQPLNFGLGDCDGKAQINISSYSVFSSLLPASEFLCKEYNQAEYVAQEEIEIKKLDTVFDEYCHPGEKLFLKIDTQGTEKQILEGAVNSLQYIQGIQLELSFVEHYQGEPLYMDMVNYLYERGFTLVALNPLNHNLKRGKLFQADGIFWRLSR